MGRQKQYSLYIKILKKSFKGLPKSQYISALRKKPSSIYQNPSNATITIADWSDEYSNICYVNIADRYSIKTTVTTYPTEVDNWITHIEYTHRHRLHRLIVGLNVEWRPSFNRHINNPVATLQICVGRICLIYQLLHTPYFPQSLINFLSNQDYTFVGIGFVNGAERLVVDHGIAVANTVELGDVAAEKMALRRNAGLKELAEGVLGLQVEKPRNVTLSRWDAQRLSYQQISYASVDGFLSFEIGRTLNASSYY